MDPARDGYEALIERARGCLDAHDLEGAEAFARSAAGADPGAPAAFHLLGVVSEARSDRRDAQRFYRVALALDPAYGPALHQLQRSMQPPSQRTSPLWPPPAEPIAGKAPTAEQAGSR